MIHILALGPNGEFGQNGGMPWPRHAADLKHFKNTTSMVPGSFIVMGRNTYESLPQSFSFCNRHCIVITSNTSLRQSNVEFMTFDEMITKYTSCSSTPWFVIGGISLLKETLKWTTKIIITRMLHLNLEADVLMDITTYPPNSFRIIRTKQLDKDAHLETYIKCLNIEDKKG